MWINQVKLDNFQILWSNAKFVNLSEPQFNLSRKAKKLYFSYRQQSIWNPQK